MADFRFALRVLGRTRMLTLVVVLSLGLGIGANTAIFSFLHHIVLRSLPVRNPDELVVLQYPGDFKGGRQSTSTGGGIDSVFSYPMFRGFEKAPQGVTGVAGFRMIGANLSFRNQTVDGGVLLVSGRYFGVLGVEPATGRTITPEDDVHGAGRPVAVLSHGYWRNRLGGRLDVLNQPLRINGRVLTIVGIAPRKFTGTVLGEQPDAFVPLALKPDLTPGWNGTDRWDDYWLYLLARVKPGVTSAQATAALNTVFHGLIEQHLATLKDFTFAPDSARFRKTRLTLVDGNQGQSEFRDANKTPVLILMACTVLVLLIAIANTANVLMARAAQRRKELAIRTALGAGRGRLVRQVLAEALLLASGGAIAGALFATWTVGAITALMSDSPTRPEDMPTGLEWPVLLFCIGISLLSGLLCGLYPAWEAARSSVSGVLKDQSGQSSGTLRSARLRKVLVCAQVTLSAVLLVPTGLFLKSLTNLMRVDLGLKTGNVITFGISPELNGYKPARCRALFESAEQRLASIPGVRSVTTAMVPLIAGNNWGNGLTVEGYSNGPKAQTHASFNEIGAGFFGAMGVPLINGREFADRDTLAGPKVTVVNQAFAKHFFGNQNPIGRHIGIGMGPGTKVDIEIVGVVKDSHYAGVKQKPPRLYYTPWRQSDDIGAIFFYVSTALAPEKIMPDVRRAMHSLDGDLPLENLRTFEEQIERNIMAERIIVRLSAAFALVATLLAMVGLYGIMAYGVTQRIREFGIRIALGASEGSIRSIVFRELLLILGIGLAIGIPGAVGLSKVAESQFYGVKSFDAAVVAGAAIALSAAAALAGYLPARRATRTDPITALRYE